MSAAALRELIDERADILPLRVKQYHAMLIGGILPDGAPYELLEGYVVRKDRSASGDSPMTVGYDHAWAVRSLAALSPKLGRLGCYMQTQLPVTLPPFNEPEPDGAILLGPEADYRGRHPGAKDILAVIEVADASLRHDRGVKGRIYASSGVTQYFIINLPDRVVEAYSAPIRRKGLYRHSTILRPGQRVALPTAGDRELCVAVRSLLP